MPTAVRPQQQYPFVFFLLPALPSVLKYDAEVLNVTRNMHPLVRFCGVLLYTWYSISHSHGSVFVEFHVKVFSRFGIAHAFILLFGLVWLGSVLLFDSENPAVRFGSAGTERNRTYPNQTNRTENRTEPNRTYPILPEPNQTKPMQTLARNITRTALAIGW